MENFFRILFSALIALMTAGAIYWQGYLSSDEKSQKPKRTIHIISEVMLPILILVLAVSDICFYGWKEAFPELSALFASLFLHISFYFILLMIFLPFLREKISARVCALLWLLPNLLYILPMSFMRLQRPLFVLRIPRKIFETASIIWISGFAAVLIGSVISHILFRRKILRGARTITKNNFPKVIAVWEKELSGMEYPDKKYCPVFSDEVKTPLSIGFSARTTRVVLPTKNYTDEELSLIFRHELLHIENRDCFTKFFLVFCTAMCWFNPLMWMAMRRSADDLELSVDESVLLGESDAVRRQYADLLLCTAGDQRGFTTCLSASASALRYRLSHVMKPVKKHLGGIAAGLICFALLATGGYVTFGYDTGLGQDLLFAEKGAQNASLRKIFVHRAEEPSYTKDYKITDKAAVTDYLKQLKLEKIGSFYDYSDNGIGMTFLYGTEENGTLVIELNDFAASVMPLGQHDLDMKKKYHLMQEIDWDFLLSHLTEIIPEEIPDPIPPKLMLFFPDSPHYQAESEAGCLLLRVEETGKTETEEINTVYSSPPEFYRYDEKTLALHFTHDPYTEHVIEIIPSDGGESTFLSSDEMEDPFLLPLPDYDAAYRIYANFDIDGKTYEMEYGFTISENP